MNASGLLHAFRAAADHVRTHPETVLGIARHAVGQRLAIPIAAIRWALAEMPPGKGRPKELTVTSAPPALRIDGRFVFMGQELRARASLHVLSVRAARDTLRLELRVSDVEAEANPGTPLAQLLRSGALDLERPAKLLAFVKKRPPILAEAKDDLFELDLLQVPKLRDNRALRRALATLGPVVQVREVRTDGDFLLVALRPVPSGLRESLAAAREAVSRPASR